MPHINKIDVRLDSAFYSIHLGVGLLKNFEIFLPLNIAKARRFFIADKSTEKYARRIAGAAPVYVTDCGESTKSMTHYNNVLSWLLDHKVDRKSVLFAVGGGVVGDLAGFVAATVLRGIPVVQVPTTLLAMVDSSVGGKTGINMPQGKNLVGAFHQPAAVICDFECLQTLPERELKAGYAEILKYALLGDADFYDWLEDNGSKVLSLDAESVMYAVMRSCEMKAEIVIEDEKETSGKRALLNLGHTFAHAFEAVMGYDGRLLHGEAVSIGLLCALELSVLRGYINPQSAERVSQHLGHLKMKKYIKDIGLHDDANPKNLLEIMRGDKKAELQKINFILLKKIGEAFVDSSVADDDVLRVLSDT
jgi:3-dehydroquinate synthase